MSNTIDLFVEDRAHEEFLTHLLRRLAREERKSITLRVRSARGGHGRALSEFTLYQQMALRGLSGMTMPDLLVIAIDANCKSFAPAKRVIEEKVETHFTDRSIIACPDPHIERWYLADQVSFGEVVGIRPTIGRKKCERGEYKRILSQAIVKAGHPATLNGIEFARELVEEMDLYRAGKFERSLKHFVDDAKACLRAL